MRLSGSTSEFRIKGTGTLSSGRIRRAGGGRKKAVDADPRLRTDLEKLLESTTRGDPEAPLRWTCKSVRNLTGELQRLNSKVSHQVVADLLHELGYSLQSNRKTKEGSGHPDRNAQFEHLNGKVKWCLGRKHPVISVDTKKKELVGDFKNNGRELRPKGNPEKVRVHDFIDKELGRATPYGIYDIGRNAGWVNVGVDHDTAEFAVESIRRWWRSMGSIVYPDATRLLITADSGGSNGSRLRLWKFELQKFADETGLRVVVCHFPPGTSKWNKIEHRLFSFISQNWRGKPLISLQVIVSLIAATTTATGLTVHSELDTASYAAGIKVSDQELATINLKRDKFHGDWNYEIHPRPSATMVTLFPDRSLVPMDFNLITQVLVNLLCNAFRFSSAEQPIELQSRITNGNLEVKVLDRGRGVPDRDLDRVFEKFHRLSESTSVDGLGLGLSICKEFVEAHRGRISLEHNPGGGIIAKFLLPLETSSV